jgi:peptidoglycan/LPS O-acetylase OafA/YrhL
VKAIGATPPIEASGSPATGGGAGRRGHLDAVDVIRVVMVAGVIAVHVVGQTTSGGDVLAEGLTSILHLNREVFFVLTAFVLTYTYGPRHGWSLRKFWAKRYLYIGVPYLVWTGIYYLADGSERTSWLHALHTLMTDVLQGTARYHLYFLLVTMQIYAVFPLLLWLLRATKRHHGVLLAGALAFQLALTTVLHYRLWFPAWLGFWLNHPDPYVMSYVFYVVAGGIAATHFEEATAWVRGHARTVGALVAGGFLLAVAVYCLDHYGFGQDPAQAGEVFQPMVAFTSAAAVAGLYALGVRWADRGEGRRFRRTVAIAADTSFGVYLAHPLLLQVITIVAAPIVQPAFEGRTSSLVVLPVDFLVVMPLLFVVTAVVMRGVRHTVASLPLAGRPRLARAGAGGRE